MTAKQEKKSMPSAWCSFIVHEILAGEQDLLTSAWVSYSSAVSQLLLWRTSELTSDVTFCLTREPALMLTRSNVRYGYAVFKQRIWYRLIKQQLNKSNCALDLSPRMLRADFWFSFDVIAAMLVAIRKEFVISTFCFYHQHSLSDFHFLALPSRTVGSVRFRILL